MIFTTISLKCLEKIGKTYQILSRYLTILHTSVFAIMYMLLVLKLLSDVHGPKISCPEPIRVTTRLGQLSAIVNWTTSYLDNSRSQINVTCTPSSGSKFLPGETTITCSGTDPSGNTGYCTQVISVICKHKCFYLSNQTAELCYLYFYITHE